MTYSWTQIAGPIVTIDTPTAATSTVTLTGGVASNTEEDAGQVPYEFELEVDDGQFTDSDVVSISVSSNSCTATVESGGFYYYGDVTGAAGGGVPDCKVDLYDFVEVALNWLNCSNVFEACP